MTARVKTRKISAPQAKRGARPRGPKKDGPAEGIRAETFFDSLKKCIYGRFYQNTMIHWISAASLLTLKNEKQYRQAAANEVHPDKRNSILGAADLIRVMRADLKQQVCSAVFPAILNGDPAIFEDMGAVIKKSYNRSGTPVFDEVRFKLLAKYYDLGFRLGRLPTKVELQDEMNAPGGIPDDTFATHRMDEKQLRRMLAASSLNLDITPQPLVTALRRLSEKGRAVEVADVRKCLRRSKQADCLRTLTGGKKADNSSNLTNEELLLFGESVGLEFAPDQAIAAQHARLARIFERAPSVAELAARLKGYVLKRLKIGRDADLAAACRRLGLTLSDDLDWQI